MRKILLYALMAIVFSSCAKDGDEGEPPSAGEKSPYISEVYEYVPAPGQFINTTTSAYLDGFTVLEVLQKARMKLVGRTDSLVTLGAFGGYIVVGFDHTILNIEGEDDFKVYGNAMPNGAEPGIVMVSYDENQNGLPDDEWYEIAGSEHNNPETIRDYEITYYRPEPLDYDVRWSDNQGNDGYVHRINAHKQISYYPQWLPETITFKGTRLPSVAVNQGTEETQYWVSMPFDWGYADNHSNYSEGSNFKIEWAVKQDGSPANLIGVDFIKIYTGVLQEAGWTGEISTEVAGIKDLHFIAR